MTPVRTRFARLALATALLPAGAAVALPATAWASGSAPEHTMSLSPTGSRAAQVRSTLTAAFQSHDALGAIAQSTFLRRGPAELLAVAQTLAQSRQQLAASVGGLSPRAGALRDAFADQDVAKLLYARGVDRYSGSPARATAAQRVVTAARAEVLDALAPLVPGVPRTTLATLLSQQDARDGAATRALGVRSPLVYDLVQRAHLGTAALARTVAVALDARQGLAGSATSPAAELRARLTGLSAAHVVQTGLASDAGLSYGLRSAQYRGAAAELQANTEQLTAAVRELSGPENAAAFRAQWQRHIGDYVIYVRGLQTADPALRTAAATDLGGYVRANAVQLSRVSGLPAGALVPSLTIHTAGTLQAIRLQAAHSPLQYPVEAMGTMHFATIGDRLAAAAAVRLHLAQ